MEALYLMETFIRKQYMLIDVLTQSIFHNVYFNIKFQMKSHLYAENSLFYCMQSDFNLGIH